MSAAEGTDRGSAPANGGAVSGDLVRARRRGRFRPKGRQVDPEALEEVRALLGTASRDRAYLIEHLHRLQGHFGHLSARHLAALAGEMRLAMVEVYEVATFYAHFDIVKEEETPPPAVTLRVCDGLSCELVGSAALRRELESAFPHLRVLPAPCMGRCDTAPVVEAGHNHLAPATADTVAAALGAGETRPRIPEVPGGEYSVYRACLAGGSDREAVIREIGEAGLRGMGGAGFPSVKK